MSNIFILRVQSSEGTKRIDWTTQDTYKKLYEKVVDVFSLSSSDHFVLYREQNKKSPIPRSPIKTNFRHGDIIYLVSEQNNLFSKENSSSSLIIKSDKPIIKSSSQLNFLSKLLDIKEDDVDLQLEKIDGRIPRQQDPQLCRHNRHGKCLNCIPIEPYDEEYLKNHNPPIKHMSFQAYIRKLQNETSGDRHTFSSLENISCSIKDQCSTGHAPWPKGVCTKCQPNPMTLMLQPYRHVDNIMFENGNMVNRFLNYWRSAGHQRIGFLYGRYEVYDGVPLGVRAVVTAIYEPPQETSKDSVELIFPDSHEGIVDELADCLGIRRIGWIFTDLIPNDKRLGTGPVVHHRGNMNTLFLTAQECIMAGWFQNKHLNRCKYSPDGHFGAKFVTVVVTGDASGQIQFEGYQVSNQCMALVKSDILLPTYDAPELGYIKETSSEQYVPDVYYKEKDSYNNEIMKIARPLPLEYLIIDIPTGFPTANAQIQSTFNDNCSIITIPFCVENRTKINELQDMDTLALYVQQFAEIDVKNSKSNPYKATDILADLHLLLYLVVNDIFQFSMDQLNPLFNSLRTNDLKGVETWMEGDHWQTLLQLLQIELPSLSSSVNQLTHTDSEEQSSQWTCSQCTFLNNNSNQKCDIRSSVGSASSGDVSSDSSISSQYKVLTLTFNQDCTSLAMGTPNSYSLFTIGQENKIDEIHDCAYDSVYIIERLFSSSLIALVSNQAPRKLKVCHFKKGTEILSYSFANTILAVKLNRSRLIVCLEESIYIHNMRDMKVLHSIRDIPSNRDGLCTLSSNDENPYLAYPGSTITGEVQIFDTINLKPCLMISAHESTLAAMAFDMTGTRIATASNKGTVIRIHSAVDGSRLFEFRRGVRRAATIYSLSFSPDSMFLAASSNTETIHIFRLINQKEKPSEETSSWMGSFSRLLGDVAHYLPKQTSEVLTQDRAFATVHLQSAGMKTAIAMNVFDRTLKLFVAGYDGVVYIYEVNKNEGGECKQISQYLLFNISQNSNNQQTIIANDRRSSLDGSRQIYSSNLSRKESNAVPLSSKLTNEKQADDQLYNTALQEQNFPELPSPPPGDGE
ncbi:unnamed protein product [Rotaria sordida]|uniref:MPN domain-containing protein n=1 Tax=Rotaria sordida TaxID=392033 RepID=A0A818LFZ0_9BILA|nr:unnamed protein product [Rotaria sordida]